MNEPPDDFQNGEEGAKDNAYAAALGGVDAYALMNAASASGQPIWLNNDDLVFLFSARYNGDAFRNSYLQAEYREQTHSRFTGMVDYFIEKKLKAMAANPRMYNDYAERLEVTAMQSDAVMKKARLFGIDVSKIDVGMLVYDVEVSLQKMSNGIMPYHPHVSQDAAKFAISFMDRQLWNGDEQMLWRYVTAEKIAGLYVYDKIAYSIPLIRGLDKMIHYEFSKGEMRGQKPSVVYFGHLLSDDIIDECIEALEENEYEGMPMDWMISDIISKVQESDDEW
jgi:hypothetical protein